MRTLFVAPSEGDGGHSRYMKNLLNVWDASECGKVVWLSSADVDLYDFDGEHVAGLPNLRSRSEFRSLLTLGLSRHIHWFKRDLKVLRYIVKERSDIDCICVQDITPWYGPIVLIACRLMGIGVTSTVHNLVPHRAFGLPMGIYKWLQHWFYRHSDGLVFHSERMKESASRLGVLQSQNVQVSGFGFHEEPTVLELGPNLEILPDAPFVVFGRLRANKCIELLIEVARSAPDIPIRFCGHPESPKIERIIREATEALSNVSARLEFLTDENLSAELRSAAAALLIYRDFDSESGAYLTAIGSGCAVVATDQAGLGDLISKSETGYVLPADPRIEEISEMLRKIRDDDSLLPAARTAAWKHAEEVSGSWGTLTSSYARLFTSVVS